MNNMKRTEILKYRKMGTVFPLTHDALQSVISKTYHQEAAHITQVQGLPLVSLALCKSQLLCIHQRHDTL
jgi:hypothetical protein